MSALYAHVPDAMRHQLCAELTKLGETALEACREMDNGSPVRALDGCCARSRGLLRREIPRSCPRFLPWGPEQQRGAASRYWKTAPHLRRSCRDGGI